jgi:hypothetical protein
MHHRTAMTLAVLACATRAAAQMPGAPLLQNAWASPGVVGAVNFAGGSDGPIYGAAVALATSSARLQLSGGIGIRSGTGSGSRTNSVYGVRLALPFGGQTGAFGLAAFAGVGAGASVSASPADSLASTTIFPIGAAIGWRHALGATAGFSVYATPSYIFFTGESSQTGLVRASLGVDVGLTKAIGITVGTEFGQGRPRAEGGPSGTLFGLGLSYALGRR